MSTKNDKSAIVIIVFAALFIFFAFIKQFEEKPIEYIVYTKYIHSNVLGTIYFLESKDNNNRVYQIQVDKNTFINTNVGNHYQGKWRIK